MSRYLILGNGFDLAHGLPTAYKDFLYVCAEFVGRKHNITVNNHYIEEVKQKYIRKNDENEKLRIMIKENMWLDHFYCEYENLGLNWIDFEKEMKQVCEEYARLSRKVINPLFIIKSGKRFNMDESKKSLKDLIYILNSYLLVVKEISISICYPDVINFLPTKIINFNYTNTFDKVYSDMANTDYIHGQIISEEKNTIVLGFEGMIDENNDILFSDFLKYIQIVQNDIIIDSYVEMQNYNNNESTFFGHSLDETDKDLIIKIIECSKRVNILYKDDLMKKSIILNLIKIYGRNKFIELTSSVNKKIFFIEQGNYVDGKRDEIEFIYKSCFGLVNYEKYGDYIISIIEKYNVGYIPLLAMIRKIGEPIRLTADRVKLLKRVEQYLNTDIMNKYGDIRDKDHLIEYIENLLRYSSNKNIDVLTF